MNRWIPVLAAIAALQIPVIVGAAEEALVLSVATADHPHVRALRDGRIAVQGCRVAFSTQTMSALTADLNGAKKYDALEVELLPYLEKKAAGGLPEYTLIPVFLSRGFQMRQLFIRTDRGIQRPEDLRGKTIGVSGYGNTSPTWVRGILQSSWSVKPADIVWIDTEDPASKVKSLAAGLASGQLDGAITDDLTQDFLDKNPKIVRFFTDYKKAEYETFQKTRIFPILTAVAVRKTLIDQNPWLPEALFLAFSEAKDRAMADLTLPPPWGGSRLEDTQKLMGKNFWSYGIKSNPKTLKGLFTYINTQKLLARELSVQEVFDPSTQQLIEPN